MKKTTFVFAIVAGFLCVAAFATVQAQVWKPDPIVIVPGVMASWNPNVLFDPTPEVSLKGWSFTPTVKEYNQLIKAFEDAGLVRDQDFFVAFYDWRQSNDDSATNYLIPIIDRALAHSQTGKVNIVAHSMGGLVARSYIQSDAYRDDVGNFIMLGTPNHGSSDAYEMWEGAAIPKSWPGSQKSVVTGYLWYTAVTGVTPSRYETIHTYIPSLRELLPTYDYLTEKSSGNTIAVSGMQERNLFLDVLNLESNVLNLSGRASVTVIAGDENNTVGMIPVTPHAVADGNLWIDGKPDPLTPQQNDMDGDNRVLLSSAFFYNGFPDGVVITKSRSIPEKIFGFFTYFFASVAHAQDVVVPNLPPAITQMVLPSSHGDLPTTGIPSVFSILGMDSPAIAYAPIPEAEATLNFWFASPIDVQITSPSGKTITKGTNTIPGAFYDGASDPLGFKMVIIENPEPGEYKVDLTGLAVGGYHMGVGSLVGQDDVVATVAGDVVADQKIGYVVAYDPTNLEAPAQVSEPILDEEPTAQELLDEIIELVQSKYDNGNSRERGVYRPLLATLRVAKFFMDHERDRLATKTLLVFEGQVRIAQKRSIIPVHVAEELLEWSSAIRTLIR